jgi:hypothetical protein
MKRLVLTITLASLAALHSGGGAAPRPRQCPEVVVSCLDVVRPGLPVTFNASVDNLPADAKPTFNWAVSAGTISSGQGTSSVTVDTTGVPNGYLTATVDVRGLPEGCPASGSCATDVVGIRDPNDKVDEYADISFGDEKARLDNYAIELLNWPESVGYIVGYGGRRSRRGEAARRIERAKRYLVTARAVPAERVVTIDGGYREDLTVELRLRTKDMPPPEAVPTVDPSEVKFIEPAARRGGGRRRRR